VPAMRPSMVTSASLAAKQLDGQIPLRRRPGLTAQAGFRLPQQ
jgi:hypothetical protein